MNKVFIYLLLFCIGVIFTIHGNAETPGSNCVETTIYRGAPGEPIKPARFVAPIGDDSDVISALYPQWNSIYMNMGTKNWNNTYGWLEYRYPYDFDSSGYTYFQSDNCSMYTTYEVRPEDIVTTLSSTNPTITGPGSYSIIESYDDAPKWGDDSPLSNQTVLTICFWTTQYQCTAGSSITPGGISKGGETFDNGTIFIGMSTTSMSLYEILSTYGIGVGAGSDTDKKYGFGRNYFTGAITTTCNEDVADTVDVSTAGTVDVTVPGIYDITFTWYDQATAAFTAKDSNVCKKINVIVFQVEITNPTSWPQDVAINNKIKMKARVEPSEIQGLGTFSWFKVRGDGSCEFSPVQSAADSTVFIGRGATDVWIKAGYTIGDSIAVSDAKHVVVFTLSVAKLKFTDNHPIQSNTTQISDTAWDISTTPSVNNPVCYTRNQNVKMNATFAANTVLSGTNPVYFRLMGTDTVQPECLKTISYSGITVEISGFSNKTGLSNYVHSTSITYQWYYCTDTENWNLASATGPHKIYVTLAAPQAPMAVPWTEVLDMSCAWAEKTYDQTSALYALTTGAYFNCGKSYDGGGTHSPYTQMNLKRFLNEDWADCRDMSAYLQVISDSIGVNNVNVRMLSDVFNYKEIRPVGWYGTTTGEWNFHQVGYVSNVYDACLELQNTSVRVPKNEDINGSYKTDLYSSGIWTPGSLFRYTSVLSTYVRRD